MYVRACMRALRHSLSLSSGFPPEFPRVFRSPTYISISTVDPELTLVLCNHAPYIEDYSETELPKAINSKCNKL